MLGKSLTATAAESCPRNIKRRLQKSAPRTHFDFDSNLDSGLSKEARSCCRRKASVCNASSVRCATCLIWELGKSRGCVAYRLYRFAGGGQGFRAFFYQICEEGRQRARRRMAQGQKASKLASRVLAVGLRISSLDAKAGRTVVFP